MDTDTEEPTTGDVAPDVEEAVAELDPDAILGSMGRGANLTAARIFLDQSEAGGEIKAPGSAPGIDQLPNLDRPPAPGTIRCQCIDYGSTRVTESEYETIDDLLASPREEWAKVRWINVDGLHPYVVNQLKGRHVLHTLAAEDVLTTPQRPKIETYDDHLFLVVRMLTLENGALRNEQVSLFFFQDLIITFQEQPGDVWGPVRQRIERPQSRFRRHDAGYLLYALLDSIVDHAFPILELYGDILESLELDVLESPKSSHQQRIHSMKRDLIVLRRVMWPMREIVHSIMREDFDKLEIQEAVKPYFGDVYDHAVQVIDLVETLREIAAGVSDLYMTSISNRMNETMKVLTIMASFFIPITFVAGVYGMNFDHMPELHWKYAYGGFWFICLALMGGLWWFFSKKGWIGKDS